MKHKVSFYWNSQIEPIRLGSLIMFRKAVENHIEFTEPGKPILYFLKNNFLAQKDVKLIKNIFSDTKYSIKFSLNPESEIINPWDEKINHYSTWFGIDYQISNKKGRQELLWSRKSQANFQNFITCHLRVKRANEPSQLYHSKIENWTNFFSIKKDQKFLLLGNEPYPREIMKSGNVSKANGDLNQQLSLIASTMGFIGCASGFSAAAVLSKKPVFVFKHPDHHPEECINPNFLNANQFQVRQEDTLQNIINGLKLCMT